ncbi:MAG: hypothetical protein JKY32_09510 [Rhizobiales bacterium]|nr:hypothetical protein [Hyphomicrobiales bacterium]
MTRKEREAIAAKRLHSVLGAHGAAISRTIEQKISDAGPFNQRIDPHILIPVRNELVKSGELRKIRAHGRDWFALSDTPQNLIDKRIEAQFDVLRLTLDNNFSTRVGDALEIAIYRALGKADALNSLGGFRRLTPKPTTSHLKKEEPPSIFNGRELQGNKRFDFLVGTDTWAGIECKNIREWLYPNRTEIRHLLRKSIELDIPPILIGRRIPYVTRRLLQPAGMLLWETRSQFYPAEYDNIAAQIREKNLLASSTYGLRISQHLKFKISYLASSPKNFLRLARVLMSSRICSPDMPMATFNIKNLRLEYAAVKMARMKIPMKNQKTTNLETCSDVLYNGYSAPSQSFRFGS